VPESVSAIVSRLSERRSGVSEATIQSDIRNLILAAGLNLTDDEVEERVDLETQVGDGSRRRIDVEVSTTVIEVKKDLDRSSILADGEVQLGGYVRQRVKQTGARFFGILSDGRRWRLYVPSVEASDADQAETALLFVREFTLKSAADETKLLEWLGAILSRVKGLYPSPDRIEQVIGASSPTYKADHLSLQALFDGAQQSNDRKLRTQVQLKRELWSKLLTTAFGEDFTGSSSLFVDHTLLVLTAEIIAHAVLGFDISKGGDVSAEELANGRKFADARIYGVVESDFFDWPLSVEGGREFVAALANRLSRFDWAHVDHDVLKHVYESVVTAETRQQLGEYYTPDWLAERMIAEVDYDPLEKRVLDASCGSGTFVFHAVRRYLERAEAHGSSSYDAIAGAVEHVFGMDIHPVAVALARVTYLLAIGSERLRKRRPGFSVPVYIGDAVQWEQSANLFAHSDVVAITTAGSHLFDGGGVLGDDDIQIPVSVMRNTQRFDEIMSRIATEISIFRSDKQHDARDNTKYVGMFRKHLRTILNVKKYDLSDEERMTLADTAALMYELHLVGRDGIWAYYVRNLIRPVWLSMTMNNVDILIGNPPWLRYSKMNTWMQTKFLDHSKDHNLTLGRLGTSGRDLATLFVVRACELYLREGGEFAYVMPHSALTRKPNVGFRAGKWAMSSEAYPNEQRGNARFTKVWDLQDASTGFPITSGVIFGTTTTGQPTAMPSKATAFIGRLNPASQPWVTAESAITTKNTKLAQVTSDDLPKSPYAKDFRQGAILVPRRLMWAVHGEAGPLGTPGDTIPLISRTSTLDKDPWRVDPIVAVVDEKFAFDGYLGEHLLPYRVLEPATVVLPIKDSRILSNEEASREQGLSEWWNEAERLWDEHKKPGTEDSLAERIDYHGQLSAELIGPEGYLVMYPKSGNNIAAAWVASHDAVVDHSAYWMHASSRNEARYLTGILNSTTLVDRIRPLQAVGLFGARHFDKYVFSVPYGRYDETDGRHQKLATLVERAEEVAAAVDVSSAKTFQAARKQVRGALVEDGIEAKIESMVEEILPEISIEEDELDNSDVSDQVTDSIA